MVRSYLASRAIGEPKDENQIRAMAAQVWHQRGLALLDPKEIRDDWMRQVVVNLANERFGRRESR